MGNTQHCKMGYMYQTRQNGDWCVISKCGIDFACSACYVHMLSGPNKGDRKYMLVSSLITTSEVKPTLEQIDTFEMYKHIKNIYDIHGFKPTYVEKTIYEKQHYPENDV